MTTYMLTETPDEWVRHDDEGQADTAPAQIPLIARLCHHGHHDSRRG